MTRSETGGGPGEHEVTGAGFDLEALIASANAQVEAAAKTAYEEQVRIATTKTADEEGMSKGYEQLAEWSADLSLDDSFIGDYVYEQFVDTAEEVTGEAMPEGTKEVIASFRKADSAYKKILENAERLGVGTESFKAPLEQLQAARVQLLEQVKNSVGKAIDKLKRKHKDEYDDLKKQFEGLKDSPLTADITNGSESKEAKEVALKQEIVDLMLRPAVDSYLKPMESDVSLYERQIAAMDAALKVKYSWEKDGIDRYPSGVISDLFWKLGITANVQDKSVLGGFRRLIEDKKRYSEEKLSKMQAHIQRVHLAFDVNHRLANDILADEHDETALQEAVSDLRIFFGKLRKIDASTSPYRKDFEKMCPQPNSGLARKLLEEFANNAVSIEGMVGFDSYGSKNWGKDFQDINFLYPNEKGLGSGGNIDRLFYEQVSKSGLQDKLVEVGVYDPANPDDYVSSFLGKAGEFYQQESGFRHGSPQSAVFALDNAKKFFPSLYSAEKESKIIQAVFGGRGRELNLTLACRRVDAGYLPANRPRLDAKYDELPEVFAANGWAVSKSGAFVEPGQNVNEVDADFKKLLEDLSAKQISGERMFDVRGGRGEFHIYTVEQAMDIIRRMRRDVRELLSGSKSEVGVLGEKMREKEQEAGGLLGRITALETRLEGAGKLSAAQIKELGILSGEKEEWLKKETALDKKVKDLEAEVLRLGKKVVRADALVGHIEAARKSGFTGAKYDASQVDAAVASYKG